MTKLWQVAVVSAGSSLIASVVTHYLIKGVIRREVGHHLQVLRESAIERASETLSRLFRGR